MSRVAAFIAGLGTGYMQQSERERDRARQEKRDQQEQDRHDAFLKDRADAEAKRKRLVEASKPASVNENAATLDMGAGPKVYDMPEAADVAASDMRQANRLGVPNVQPPQRTLAVNGIAFGDRGAAAARTEQYNSDEATDKRVAAAHLANGDYDKARSVQREATRFSREEILWAKKMKDEGAEETAKAMLTGDANTVFETFNANGTTKLKAPPTVESVDMNIPGFGVVKNHIYKGVLVNPDGTETPFTRDSYTANKVLLKFKDLLQLQGQGAERAENAKHREATLAEQKRSNRAREGIAGATLQITRENAAEARKTRESQTLSGKVTALETALGRRFEGEERDKVVLKLAGLGKDDESINKFANSVVQEGVKGGTIDPKNVGAARQQVIASIKQANQDAETARVISTELGAAKGDSTKYTQTYEKVLKIPGVTAEYLTSIGYPPPAKLKPPAPKPMASAGIPRPRVSFGPVTEGAANAQDR